MIQKLSALGRRPEVRWVQTRIDRHKFAWLRCTDKNGLPAKHYLWGDYLRLEREWRIVLAMPPIGEYLTIGEMAEECGRTRHQVKAALVILRIRTSWRLLPDGNQVECYSPRNCAKVRLYLTNGDRRLSTSTTLSRLTRWHYKTVELRLAAAGVKPEPKISMHTGKEAVFYDFDAAMKVLGLKPTGVKAGGDWQTIRRAFGSGAPSVWAKNQAITMRYVRFGEDRLTDSGQIAWHYPPRIINALKRQREKFLVQRAAAKSVRELPEAA
jgi:hypothetical protein